MSTGYIGATHPGEIKWRTIEAVIGASASADLDVVPLTNFNSTKYYIELRNAGNTLFKSFEVFCFRKGSSDVSDTIFARIGDALAIEANVYVSSGYVKLELVNNEAFPITCKVTKLFH